MMQQSPDPSAALRKAVYLLLIVVTAGAMIGRTLTVQSARKNTPFLSANDRSRWCTVRALVDEGTYQIDLVIYKTERGKIVKNSKGQPVRDPDWQTIDMVMHKGRDGRLHAYSSKPPLLPTLLAGEYWLVKRLTGMTLVERPFYVGYTILILTNILPLLLYFAVLARWVERWGTTDWGRLLVMTVATFGTYLTSIAVTLNNHLPAAVSVLLAVDAAARIWYEGERRLRYFAQAGLFAAFAAANELPALSFLTLLSIALLLKAPRQTILAYLPAAAIVVAAFFVTNYVAHDSWLPPYMHRGADDNWYDYERSYWRAENRQGTIDQGEQSRAVYAMNVLVGHHGVFSLTPVWLLSAAGLLMLLAGRQSKQRELAVMVGILTAVCFAFYVARPLQDRNYGGVTSGFRWLYWFTPLWLMMMLPAADAMSHRRFWRATALLLLAISALSAGYAALNPWSHPWIYRYWEYLEWNEFLKQLFSHMP